MSPTPGSTFIIGMEDSPLSEQCQLIDSIDHVLFRCTNSNVLHWKRGHVYSHIPNNGLSWHSKFFCFGSAVAKFLLKLILGTKLANILWSPFTPVLCGRERLLVTSCAPDFFSYYHILPALSSQVYSTFFPPFPCSNLSSRSERKKIAADRFVFPVWINQMNKIAYASSRRRPVDVTLPQKERAWGKALRLWAGEGKFSAGETQCVQDIV